MTHFSWIEHEIVLTIHFSCKPLILGPRGNWKTLAETRTYCNNFNWNFRSDVVLYDYSPPYPPSLYTHSQVQVLTSFKSSFSNRVQIKFWLLWREIKSFNYLIYELDKMQTFYIYPSWFFGPGSHND